MTATPSASDRVWTVPNVISMMRILLIGVFLYLLVNERDGWAIAALMAAGISDFLDGFLARRWNQVTELGRILDPAADRLLTIAVAVGLGLRGIVPWAIIGIILLRDVVVGIVLLWGKSRGDPTPQVTFAGKAATFGLYVFLPLAYLGFERWELLWELSIVGIVVSAGTYWAAGIGYMREVRQGARGAVGSESDAAGA